MVVARSNRQASDWLNRRNNKRSRRLDINLTGKEGNLFQALAVRTLREWETQIPYGDSITFFCQSAKADKQFRVWKRWFMRHENMKWNIYEESKSFFFYRSKPLE
jgi:hypothetical protein